MNKSQYSSPTGSFKLKVIEYAEEHDKRAVPVFTFLIALLPTSGVSSLGPSLPENSLPDTRIEDGKLLYERRWYHRGQPVYVEGKDHPRFAAVISAIGTEAIWVKKTIDSSKVRIYISQLSRGKVTIKRRAS